MEDQEQHDGQDIRATRGWQSGRSGRGRKGDGVVTFTGHPLPPLEDFLRRGVVDCDWFSRCLRSYISSQPDSAHLPLLAVGVADRKWSEIIIEADKQMMSPGPASV